MPSPTRDPRRQNPNDPRNTNKRASSTSPQQDGDDQRKLAKEDGSTFSPRLGSGAIGQIEGVAPTQEQISRVLTELIAQTAESASLQTTISQAEAQLKHATAEFEVSQTDKYRNFAAIKEQAQLNKERAEERLNKARGAASKQRTSNERVVQLLAGYIAQGGRQDSAVARHDARIDGLTRDLSSLSTRLGESDANRNTESKAKTAELEKLRTYVEQEIARMNDQVKEIRTSIEGLGNRTSKKEASQQGEMSSHDTSITKLNITTATLSHRIDDFSKGLEARLEKAMQNMLRSTAFRDEIVNSTTEAVEAKIRIMLNSLESRLLGYENDRGQSATRDDIKDIKVLVDTARADIQELQKSRALAVPSTAGQSESSEPYGVASFSFAPPASTAVAQVNGHNQQAAPASFAGEIAQLKAAIRSHRSRLDNMTTDQVVQAMVRQLEVLYPHAANTQQSIERLQNEQEQVRTLASSIRSDVNTLELAVFEVRDAVGDLVTARQKEPSSEALQNLERWVGNLSSTLTPLQTRYDDAFERLFKTCATLQDRVAQAETVMREQVRVNT